MTDYLKTRGEFVKRDERKLFKRLADETRERFGRRPVFVNIGVSWGSTLHCLRAGAKDATLIGIDIDLEYRKLQGNPQAILIEGDSNALWQRFEAPIHLLLIDGGHDYRTVRGDILGWTPKVVRGGAVAFHDYDPRPGSIKHEPDLVGVQKAVDELIHEDSWEDVGRAVSSIAFRKQ